jgi:hydrogenase maturation protease
LSARVVGVGQRAAGDDGVGFAVVEHLEKAGVRAGVELTTVAEPSALVPLLESIELVVIVDAVLAAGRPGQVLVLAPDDLAGAGARPLSSHGMSVPQAIELARTLAPGTVARRIDLVAVTIAEPLRRIGLSDEVARAVPRAAGEVLRLLTH